MSKQSERTCLFCGNVADSREHILPDWIGELIGTDELVVHFRQLGQLESDRKTWERKPFQERTRFVCTSCNGGWMSELEDEAKPVLANAIARKDLPYSMTPTDQLVAASWAMKTLLVFQGSQTPEPMSPPAFFRRVLEEHLPPTQASIWISSNYRAIAHPVDFLFVQKPLTIHPEGFDAPGAEEFGYMAYVAVGGLCFVIVAHTGARRFRAQCSGPFADSLTKIWPIRLREIEYPGRTMMAPELVDLLFERVEPPSMQIHLLS